MLKKIPVLLVIGTAYFIFVFILGASCYGMECIGLVVFGYPVMIGSLPWGFLANIFPDILAKEDGLLMHPFLNASTWPGLVTIYLGFIFNLWLLSKIAVWLINKKKSQMRMK